MKDASKVKRIMKESVDRNITGPEKHIQAK
jgi:hypothetical protein